MNDGKDDNNSLFRMAISANTAGRCEEAMPVLRLLIEREPDNEVFHWGLGMCYLEANVIDAAIESFNMSVAIEPQFALGWEGLGMAFWAQGEYEKAEAALRHRVSLLRDARGLVRLARVVASLGRREEALENCRQAVLVDPRDEVAYYHLGVWSTYLQKYDEAEEYFRQAISINPRFAIAYSELGFLQYGLGDTAGAVETLKKAIQLDPRLKEPRFYVALALKALGNLGDARDELQTAIQLCDTDSKRLELQTDFDLAPSPGDKM
jgi:tetratricopeptide (TPR) repeat protein